MRAFRIPHARAERWGACACTVLTAVPPPTWGGKGWGVDEGTLQQG
jgi:hypothetical protein